MKFISFNNENVHIDILKTCTKIKNKIDLLERIKKTVGSEIICDYKGLRLGEKIKVFLIGEFSAGKTTYIERFLEKLVGTTSPFPETATLIEHEGGDSELFTIFFNKEYDAKQKSKEFAKLLENYKLKNRFRQYGTLWQPTVKEITVDWDQPKCNGFIKASNNFNGFIKRIKWTHSDINILDYASFYDLPGIHGVEGHDDFIRESINYVDPDILICLIATSEGTPSGDTIKYIYNLMQEIYTDKKRKKPIFFWCYQKGATNLEYEGDDNIWFNEWRVYTFSEKEFKYQSNAIKSLIEEIKRIYPESKYLENINDIDFLNKTLQVPDFFDKCASKIGETIYSDQDINKLIEKTEQYRDKEYETLKANQQKNIRALNRLILEKLYPYYCPKNQSVLVESIKSFAEGKDLNEQIIDDLIKSPLIYAMGEKDDNDIAKESVAKMIGYYFRRTIDNYFEQNKRFEDIPDMPKILQREKYKIQNPIQLLRSFFEELVNRSQSNSAITQDYIKKEISDLLGINNLSDEKLTDDNLKFTAKKWKDQVISAIDEIIAKSNMEWNPLSSGYKADLNFFADFGKQISSNKQWIVGIYLAQALLLLIAYHNNMLGKYYLGDFESEIAEMINDDVSLLNDILASYPDLRDYIDL